MINQLQNQIAELQNQLATVLNIANQSNGLKTAKPDKCSGKYVRTWLKSINNIFENQTIPVNEANKIKYAVSYLSGEGLQWWELVNINPEINIQTFQEFGEKMLEYIEPVNREVNARKAMNALKQMGQYSKIRDYNKKFTEFLLQIPSMSTDEQIFHYTQGLKTRIRIELERSEVKSLQAAMKLADRMDHLYDSSNPANFGIIPNSAQNPTPMEIGNINFQKTLSNKPKRLPHHIWKKLMEENRCFVCKKVGCRASNHHKNPAKN